MSFQDYYSIIDQREPRKGFLGTCELISMGFSRIEALGLASTISYLL